MPDRRTLMKTAVATALGAGAVPPGWGQMRTSSRSIFAYLPPEGVAAVQAGQGHFDCAEAIRAALRDSFTPLHFPAGRYFIGSSIRIAVDPGRAAFAMAPVLHGDGIGRTIFDNGATDGPMFDIDSAVDHRQRFAGVMGLQLGGFSITASGTGPTTAVQLRANYMARISQLHITNQRGSGIVIPCDTGDNDGSNMVRLEQVRIENCTGWGIDATGADGHDETSFLTLDQVFVQACGTPSSAAIPPSGGMRYKGQIVRLSQCAFTINENVGFYVPGAPGLAQLVEIEGTAFENNHMRHILCTGVSGFRARQIDLFNNDTNRAQTLVTFDGSRNTIRDVDIDGVIVRATVGNAPCTAFQFKGANLEADSCRVHRVVWDNYDYPGQTRFDGVSFDPIAQQGMLVIRDPATLALVPGSGAHTPLRLRGRGSSGGEWVAHRLPPNGISIGTAGLVPNSRYAVYLWDDNNITRLELSTTEPRAEPMSGYPVKADDASRLFLGTVSTDARGGFAHLN